VIFIYLGALYYFIESLYNAIFTKPHNKRINRIMLSNDDEERIVNKTGFSRLFMMPFASVISAIAYLMFLFPVVWYVKIIPFILLFSVTVTILELLVGMLTVKYFKCRLWDYRSNRYNYKGHICLKNSLLWFFVGAILFLLFYIRGLK